MLLHNHGTFAVGRTCADAFTRMYFSNAPARCRCARVRFGDSAMDHRQRRT